MIQKKLPFQGERHEIAFNDPHYPSLLKNLDKPPAHLYVLGSVDALAPGLAIVGARKATPYGFGCAKRFAGLAAERGVTIVSGGARGCDSSSHEAALAVDGKTVAVLGGGIDRPYPVQNIGLFQRIVDGGGALVSEHPWDVEPLPYQFRLRNRLIAGLSQATLIVEAGMPSGTFSTADAALNLGRDVLVIPGSITSQNSKGSNQLLLQGAIPVIDNESFLEIIDRIFPTQTKDVKDVKTDPLEPSWDKTQMALLAALDAEVLDIETLLELTTRYSHHSDPLTWLMRWLAESQSKGLIASYPGGRYGPCLRPTIDRTSIAVSR